MVMWPSLWQTHALAALQVPDTEVTYRLITAWQQSTPLPPYSYNPLGMPAGSSGAKPYLSTQYAQFGSVGMFYKALAAFAASYTGKTLAVALSADAPYPGAWRAIAALKWPASATETDYPSVVLDLTEVSYRQSVKATPRPMRKTSGLVVAPNADQATVLAHARPVHGATQALTDARSQVTSLLRRHANDGLRVHGDFAVTVNRDQSRGEWFRERLEHLV